MDMICARNDVTMASPFTCILYTPSAFILDNVRPFNDYNHLGKDGFTISYFFMPRLDTMINSLVIGSIVALLIIIMAVYYYNYVYKSCKSDTDCTSPNTCQNSKCGPAGGAAAGGAAASGQPEVYNYDVGRYGLTYAGATNAATALNGTLATYAQLGQAWGAGADWCAAGFDSAGNAVYPVQTSSNDCGNAGIVNYGNRPSMGSFGANIYGVKPTTFTPCSATTAANNTPCMYPFNKKQWSQYSSS